MAILSLVGAAAAVRIASLDLCADEYLLMFARRDQIASVSKVVADRSDSPLWRVAHGLPTNRGQIEDLIALRPDVILKTGGGGRSTADIARRLGIRTIQLPYPSTIDEVARNVRTVAKLTGNVRAAKRWQDRLDAIRRISRPKVDATFVGQGGLTVGPASLSAQWMGLAGYRQIPISGGRLTLETLLVDAPPLLLKSSYRRSQTSRGQQWLAHPLLAKAAARSVLTDGRPWTCAGPLMPYEIERLRSVG